MISQEKILDNILFIVGDIQISSKNRCEFLEDPMRRSILELRERLIEIADELRSIYLIRDANEKDGFLPHTDHGFDDELVKEAKTIFERMCALNTDIGKEVQYGL